MDQQGVEIDIETNDLFNQDAKLNNNRKQNLQNSFRISLQVYESHYLIISRFRLLFQYY